jgi:scyllo-inositol 2-dehydrogenase (NAD+)
MRAAVVGCGRMGAFPSESVQRFAPRCWFPLSHAEAIVAHPALTLEALCDADPQALQRAASAFRVGRCYRDYRQLLQESRPQLLGIATRTSGRAQIIQDAVAHGVRALHVEKPLCNSVAELAALEVTLGRDELFCTYGTLRRYMRVYRAALERAQSGEYGELREIRVNMGRGLLYWTHPHAVDLILWAAGGRRVAGIQARLGDVVRGGAAELVSDPYVVSATIYFEDGLVGHITQAPGSDLYLSCRDGEVTVENDGRALSVARSAGADPYPTRVALTAPPVPAAGEGTLTPMSQLAGCLAGEAEQLRDNSEVKAQMLRGQRILFAIAQSHLEHSRLVDLREVDPALVIRGKSGERYA